VQITFAYNATGNKCANVQTVGEPRLSHEAGRWKIDNNRHCVLEPSFVVQNKRKPTVAGPMLHHQLKVNRTS
jgi:hypothetical protein